MVRDITEIDDETPGTVEQQLDESVLLCFTATADGLARELEEAGIRVILAVSLAEVDRAIAAGVGVAVFCAEDLSKKTMAGLRKSLEQQPEWADLPLIVLGEREELGRVREGFDSEAANIVFVRKPLEVGELSHFVRVGLRNRRRQHRLRDLLLQRKNLLSSIQDSFVILDRDWVFIYANDQVHEGRGRTPEELVGKCKWDLFPEIVGSSYHQALLEAAETLVPRRVEYFETRSHRWVEYRIYPSETGVSVLGTDITERKLSENVLRESEERHRLMVQSAREYAIISLDMEGRITSWNSGAHSLLGYNKEAAIGEHFQMLLTEEDQKSGQAEKELRRALAAGRAESERWYVRQDGISFWANGQTNLITDDAGIQRGFLKILQDYTGRKRAEVWLRSLNETLEKRVEERTEEAESRASQLRRLALELTNAEQRERRRLAQVLHDHLQQILVAAKMQVGMLSQRRTDEGIREALERVDDLLKKSIDASRSLTVELSPPILHDAGLAAALHWLSRNILETYRLEVTTDAEEDANPESDSIRDFLFQAARELLFNVVKHANAKSAAITLRRCGTEAEVIVTDTGAGFKSDEISYNNNGGFGLFSMRERIELLEGSLTIESETGKGTKVSVRIPLKQRDEIGPRKITKPKAQPEVKSVPAPLQEAENSGPKQIRVLLADDHRILREGLAGLLREQPGFEVVSEASDGQMAVEMARETRPDVIIMDVSMPRLNGIEATRKISKEMPEIAIVGLSMHSQEDMANSMFEAGAVGYVTKGAPSELLTAAIRAAYRKKEKTKQ